MARTGPGFAAAVAFLASYRHSASSRAHCWSDMSGTWNESFVSYCGWHAARASGSSTAIASGVTIGSSIAHPRKGALILSDDRLTNALTSDTNAGEDKKRQLNTLIGL